MSEDIFTTAEARSQFSEVINRAAYGKERVRLTRRGRTIAVVVPVEDVELLEKLEDHVDALDVLAAIKEGETRDTKPLDAVLKQLNSGKTDAKRKRIRSAV